MKLFFIKEGEHPRTLYLKGMEAAMAIGLVAKHLIAH